MFVRRESFSQFLRLYPVVSWIIGIQTVLFVLSLLLPRLYFWINMYGIGWNSLILAGEWWRLFTSIFLHSGTFHFLFNTFALIIFAPALERMLGKWKFLFAYMFAGVLGNVATLLLASRDYIHLGASGAIYGLLGVYLYMIVFRKPYMDRGSAQIVVIMLIFGALSSLPPVSFLFGVGPINIFSHLFGFIGGFLLAPVLLRGNVRQPYTYFHIPSKSAGQRDEIAFDPQRWQKRKFRRFQPKEIVWYIFIILVVIGVLSRLI